MDLPQELVGRIVVVYFLDHVSGGSKVFPCKVWGRITEIGEKSVTIRQWLTDDETAQQDETDYVAIVRGAITAISLLKVDREIVRD